MPSHLFFALMDGGRTVQYTIEKTRRAYYNQHSTYVYILWVYNSTLLCYCIAEAFHRLLLRPSQAQMTLSRHYGGCPRTNIVARQQGSLADDFYFLSRYVTVFVHVCIQVMRCYDVSEV